MTDRATDTDILEILKEIQELQKQHLAILKGIKAELARKPEKVGNSDAPLIIYEGEYLPKFEAKLRQVNAPRAFSSSS